MKLSPMEAKTEQQVCLLTDNHDAGDFWILTDSHKVTIAQQSLGCENTQKISIPVREFKALIRWYIRQQKCKTT